MPSMKDNRLGPAADMLSLMCLWVWWQAVELVCASCQGLELHNLMHATS